MAFKDYFLPVNQLKLIHKAWSFRFAVVGTVLEACYAASPEFQAAVTPTQFLCGMIVIGLAILLSRIMNQTGIDF